MLVCSSNLSVLTYANQNPLLYTFFSCGTSTPFRVMASPYGTSRLHSLVTSHSVGLWGIDQPEAETSTWQNITLTRDKYSCPRRDSNPQFQQATAAYASL